MTNLTKLAALKSMLQVATDFHFLWNKFYDLLESRDFIAECKPSKLEHLSIVINAISNAHSKKPEYTLQKPIIMRYENSDFYHGFALGQGQGCTGVFIYFKDIDQGMLHLVEAGTAENNYFKFALAVIDSKHAAILPGSPSRSASYH